MSTTRRCFLQMLGGATAGMILSPLPWKLLDDASIWTQNWDWIPRVPYGPVSFQHTTCTLCAAGCGVTLRRVGERTVSAWGMAGHPVSGNRLCPLGLGLAQTPYHPDRIRGPVARKPGSRKPGSRAEWRLVSRSEALTETARRIDELRRRGLSHRLAILDLRPGRSLSRQYRHFLAAAGGGRYLTLPGARDTAARTLGELVETSGREPALDFARAGAVLGFGSRLFGDPAVAWTPADHPYLVQVEPNGSAESSAADIWLPIRPGSEAGLALGLAHMIRRQRPAVRRRPAGSDDAPFWTTYQDLVESFTPARTAEVTGILPAQLARVADELERHGPVLALGGGAGARGPLGHGEELAIWALNLQLRDTGGEGPVTLRRGLAEACAEVPCDPAESIRELPDGSLDLLLVDGMPADCALPAGLLRRKMRGPDSLIVGMSAFAAGPTREADLIIPAAAPGEFRDDVPPRALALRNSYALAVPFASPPSCALHPAELLEALATAAGLPEAAACGKAAHEALLQGRAAALAAGGQGEVFDPRTGRTTPAGSVGGTRPLMEILGRGGCWSEPAPTVRALPLRPDPGRRTALAAELAAVADGRLQGAEGVSTTYPLILVLEDQALPAASGALPPVINKLYRESNFLGHPGQVEIHPRTAGHLGCREGRTVRLTTPLGSLPVRIGLDETVQPGVVRMAAIPCSQDLGDEGPADGAPSLCGAGIRPVWRITRAAIQEV